MGKGHLSVSWGPSGGFYFVRKGTTLRLCLWRVAFTYLHGIEVDDLLRSFVASPRPGPGGNRPKEDA